MTYQPAPFVSATLLGETKQCVRHGQTRAMPPIEEIERKLEGEA